jgi:predicted RecB family nuclease
VNATVLLDAGVVTRCRRRVHLEHDPAMVDAPRAAPDPTGAQRRADANVHRRQVADRLAQVFGSDWMEVPADAEPHDRARISQELLAAGAPYIWGALLPPDVDGSRRGHVELLVRVPGGYVPIIVVRHKITDPGSGAPTTPFAALHPHGARPDPRRRVRPQPRDQLRLAHLVRLLRASGHHPQGPAMGGAIGLDADAVLWHDLDATTWPNGRSAMSEYDARFADRLAIAHAARSGSRPLARPSRVTECRSCPWWPVCEVELNAERDVSLVLRGEDAVALRGAGVSTVDELAALNPATEPPAPLAGMSFADAVLLSRAWLADFSLVRRLPEVRVPRADVELDVDMESFGDAGAYLWGSWLSGTDIGLEPGYRAFATWCPLPTQDEGRSFAEFWTFLTTVRVRAAARGLSFRAFCYNELAENRWLIASAQRFGSVPGVPSLAAVQEFIDSSSWVDMFGAVREQFLCAHGKGLKTIAPAAGFTWRDPEAGGENSMRWYRDAVGLEGGLPDPTQRDRLLRYNEDDVRATFTLRTWMSSPDVLTVPYAGDL